jgi:hypothetical protein
MLTINSTIIKIKIDSYYLNLTIKFTGLNEMKFKIYGIMMITTTLAMGMEYADSEKNTNFNMNPISTNQKIETDEKKVSAKEKFKSLGKMVIFKNRLKNTAENERKKPVFKSSGWDKLKKYSRNDIIKATEKPNGKETSERSKKTLGKIRLNLRKDLLPLTVKGLVKKTREEKDLGIMDLTMGLNNNAIATKENDDVEDNNEMQVDGI